MEEFKICYYKDIANAEWNKFVENTDEAWFWHHSEFLDAWPYGENISFVIKGKNDEILLMQSLFVEYKNTGHIAQLISKGITNELFSLGSFARSNSVSHRLENKLRTFYMSTIDELIMKYNIHSFSYCFSATLARAFWPGKCPLVNPMILYGYRNKISQAYIIDLSDNVEDIFRGFYQTTRNLIHRIENNTDYRIEEAQSTQKDLDSYYKLHTETYNRTGVTPHPKSYFEHIFRVILKNRHCHILFLYHGDQLVAAQNTLIYKDVAMYWTGASITEKGDGENRILMYEQIKYAHDIGCKWYECGEAFPYLRSGKLKGLNDYKKSFGGKLHPIFAGEYNMENKDSKVYKMAQMLNIV